MRAHSEAPEIMTFSWVEFKFKSFHDPGVSIGTKLSNWELGLGLGLVLGFGGEEVIFFIEKSPNRGLIRREKVGLGLGLSGLRAKLAEIVRGESIGDPKRPTPEEREMVKGERLGESVAVVGV